MADRPPVKLGILISGSGTNLQAIIDAIACGDLKAEIGLVISNRPDAFGLERARRNGIQALTIEHRKFASREDFDRAVAEALRERGVELVACAGFMRLLSPAMLDAFPDRIMNIHPGLLPSFPGTHAQKDAFESGVRIAGCTVFFVAPGVDDGPIIIQAAVPVMPDDDEERLAARILEQEHRIYPYAIRLYQEGRLEIQGRKVIIKGDAPGSTSAPLVNPPVIK
ncbi:MAG TPA: phosphoribosylglycinamide formyltransferase [Candidatus Binataceae bacterium]|nr:phosphoribosylglycinamide formyltransferase [Candidatus Binataceae bacterium]